MNPMLDPSRWFAWWSAMALGIPMLAQALAAEVWAPAPVRAD